MPKRRTQTSRNGETTNVASAPFVAAPHYVVCDECNELIPVDELGFNYEHNCLDPQVIREAYANLKELFAGGERNLDVSRSMLARSTAANEQ